MWTRVVVGVDGSLASLEALRRAVEAARTAESPLEVVRVWRPTVCSYSKVDYSITDEGIAAQQQQRIDETFACALGGLPPDVEVHTQVRAWEGNPGRVLTWLADRECDLLVIGSNRRGWLSGLRPNSVGRYCVRHARCRLLVVPLPEFATSVGRTPLSAKRWVRSLSTRAFEGSDTGNLVS